MKKILFILLFIVVNTFSVKVQGRISNFYLDNGMQVLLLEDHSQPEIYGAVMVHAGSKNDPEDNTGMAHYLEHLMFKGTNKMGTTEWENEKVYLDSISDLYDTLHITTNEAKRNGLLLKINSLSNTATQYAIPNEVDLILSNIGSENINAFTSKDVTVYYNKFPANQLEKWLTVYTERFRYPVFRLFQTELEAIYEEYNMYQDMPDYVFYQDFLAAAFPNHPYGREIVGYPYHLKNPQISAMKNFFCKYYQPNNMTLILVGDFLATEAKSLLYNTIGNLHNDLCDNTTGDETHQRMDTRTNLSIEKLKENRIVTTQQTTTKKGFLSYQILNADHNDAMQLELLSYILSNKSKTGMLDKLSNEKKILDAQTSFIENVESGLFAISYAPNSDNQTFEEAEQYLLTSIDSLCKGNFSDEIFNAVKMEYLRNYITEKESLRGNFYIALNLATKNIPIDDYAQQENYIRKISKNDLINTAKKYLQANHLIFRSDIGNKTTEKLSKPQWGAISSQNAVKKSLFAEEIEKLPVNPIKPKILDFDKSVKTIDYNDSYTLYCAPNPYNDIFSLDIVYNYGNLQDSTLIYAIQYLNLQGSKCISFDKFQMDLQTIGAKMEVYSTDEEFHIHLSGFEKDLEHIVQICKDKLFNPANDETKIQNLIQEKNYNTKSNKGYANYWGYALLNYVQYGNRSAYLTEPSMKQLKKYTGKQLLDTISKALTYDGYVTYTGNHTPNELLTIIKNSYLFTDNAQKGERTLRPVQNQKKSRIIIASNKDFSQSNIYFYIQSKKIEGKDKAISSLYNEYMSGSMGSVIFQEVRELRSLGYSAYSYFTYDYLNRRPCYLLAMLGTQCDKTIEGCEVMQELTTKFPERPSKFEIAKEASIKHRESTYYTFRDIPSIIKNWKEEGYTQDPRPQEIQWLKEANLDDLKNFHTQYIANRPLIVTIAGDKTRFDVRKLKKIGKIKIVKYKSFVKE